MNWYKKWNEIYDLKKEIERLTGMKLGIAFKVLAEKDIGLYPPVVANPDRGPTLVGVMLRAYESPVTHKSKTGRPQISAGGNGTARKKQSLAFRPGWHVLEIPYANQFLRKDGTWDKNLVFCIVFYPIEKDYTNEAHEFGMVNGKFRHAYAGLPYIPDRGFYYYRTNPNPDAMKCIITSHIYVVRVLDWDEVISINESVGIQTPERR